MSNANTSIDLLILGGGLSGGLIALALAEKRPELDVRIVEAGAMLGGNHIWSFFDSDVASKDRWLVAPLIAHHWDSHEVRFPSHTRVIAQGYNAIESERLDARLRAVLPPERIVRGEVSSLCSGAGRSSGAHVIDTVSNPRLPPAREHTCVTLTDGRTINARQVIDARGPGDLNTLKLGYQKFVGQVLEVRGGHGLSRPIIMDATVDQADGYRFVYCLPFSPTQVFVEDTYYTNGRALDGAVLTARIADYAEAQGWEVARVSRTESGVLPVVIGGDFSAYWESTGEDIAKAGVRAGLFQPMTSYSLPDAVRFAAAMPNLIRSPEPVEACPERLLQAASRRGRSLSTSPRNIVLRQAQGYGSASTDALPDLAVLVKARAHTHWRAGRYYRMLGVMLFRAADPKERYMIFQRFYKLSPTLIARFYAGQSTLSDKLRILMGKPPVPLFRALQALLGHSE